MAELGIQKKKKLPNMKMTNSGIIAICAYLICDRCVANSEEEGENVTRNSTSTLM